MIIETKFDLGQQVWRIGQHDEHVELPCKGCRGASSLRIPLADGTVGYVSCPRCRGRSKVTVGSFPHFELIGAAIIGSIEVRKVDKQIEGFNGGYGWEDPDERYMLSTHGFPSGSVFRNTQLYASEAEAQDEVWARNEAIDRGEFADFKPHQQAYQQAQAFLDHRDVYEHTPEHVATAELIVRAYEYEPELVA